MGSSTGALALALGTVVLLLLLLCLDFAPVSGPALGVLGGMDCKQKFEELVSQVGLCDGVKNSLKDRGFTTAADLFWTLQGCAEEIFAAVLEAAGDDKGAAPSLHQSLEADRLRRLLAVCKNICSEVGVVAPVGPDAVTPKLLGLTVGSQLAAAKVQEHWKKFDDDYHSECFNGYEKRLRHGILLKPAVPCEQVFKERILQSRCLWLRVGFWLRVCA